jgi:HEAT repeat protein
MASNRDVRLAAIEALRRFATADICDVLVDLLRVERDPLVTGAILAVLSSHGDSRAVAAVVPKLHDEDRAVQRAALAALAHFGDRTAMEAIRPLLFASGGELCHDAVRALQRLQDTEMGELLLATLSRQEEEDKHGMAIEALAILYGHA